MAKNFKTLTNQMTPASQEASAALAKDLKQSIAHQGDALIFPVAIHKDANSAYGVTVPDLPGCFSAGVSIDDALDNTREAILGHLEMLAETGNPFQGTPSAIEDFNGEVDYAGATWHLLSLN